MIQSQSKKNRINLGDYPFETDIQNRLLMSKLSVFEVNVIHEILHSSLKIEVEQLAKTLNTSEMELLLVLDKLQRMKFLYVHDNIIEVNKEMRKYFESEMLKYDDNFRADLEFFKGLLSKVPIHVLPQWYPIPKTSDDIFLSIVEKFLYTPKLYQRYLEELSFDDPFLRDIMNDVFAAPDLKVPCSVLMMKYSLTHEKLEEYLLILEFNLVCCLSYNLVNDQWEEVVTPFYEWKKYLQFEKESKPKSILDENNISKTHPEEFGFVQDMTRIILAAQDKTVSIQDAHHYLPLSFSSNYIQNLIETIVKMKFAEVKNNIIMTHESSYDWIKKPLLEQAMLLYRYSGSHIQDKDIRATEKSLKRILNIGWIYFEDFIKGFTAPIGEVQQVVLQCTGKRWRYVLPKYSKKDLALIESTIFDRLFQCGMVSTGSHNNKPCFTVTSFGKSTLD